MKSIRPSLDRSFLVFIILCMCFEYSLAWGGCAPLLAARLEGGGGFTLLDTEENLRPIVSDLSPLVYGEGKSKLAFSTWNKRQRELVIVNSRSKAVVTRINVNERFLDPKIGVGEYLAFDDSEQNVYFCGHRKDSAELTIFRVNIESGESKNMGAPKSRGLPEPVQLTDGIGAFDETDGGVWKYDPLDTEWKALFPATREDTSQPPRVYVWPILVFHDPELGVIRINKYGEIERILDRNLAALSAKKNQTGFFYFHHAQLARYKGEPVIATALREDWARRSWPITQVVFLSVESGKQVWSKVLPFPSADFAVARDGSAVWLIDCHDTETWTLARYAIQTNELERLDSIPIRVDSPNVVGCENPYAWFILRNR